MRRGELAAAALLAGLLVLGLARAAELSWACDDAFISLRYAENLVEGHGLVYNPGERVEGYTNLLWTLLLAGLMAAGVPALRAAELPGLAAYAWLAAALAWWSWRRRGPGRPFLPLAAGLVLVSDDFRVWATGGLETMLFSALATQALLLSRAGPATPRRAAGAGLLLALLVLTRPDGLLFAAPLLLSWWLPADGAPAGPRWRVAAAGLTPAALVLALWLPWKLVYYGELFPTAFYSKSALSPYTSQGLVYVALYLAKNWFLPALGLVALGVYAGGRRLLPEEERRDAAVFLAAAGLFGAYLVYVGGDFMFARRLLPAVPLLFLVLEGVLARLPRPRRRALWATAVLVAAALPFPLYARFMLIHYVSDERAFYPANLVEARALQGEAVRRALEGTPARVAFEPALCMWAYYSRLPYLAETTGLTQYSLAKLPLAERGYVGHEKQADQAWLTEHGIHFVMSREEPPVERLPEPPAPDEIYFGDAARARIHLYDHAVMDPLRGRPGVDFLPIEETLARVARRMERAPRARAEALYAGLRRFYLDRAGPRGAAWDGRLREILARK